MFLWILIVQGLSFRSTDPLCRRIHEYMRQHRDELVAGEHEVRSLLEREIADHCILQSRIKSVPSIATKMRRCGVVDVSAVPDIVGVRLVCGSAAECYRFLSTLCDQATCDIDTFDDYIRFPKTNRYQSLHIALRTTSDALVEVQIRSHYMHYVSEEGTASHSAYKARFDRCKRGPRAANKDLAVDRRTSF